MAGWAVTSAWLGRYSEYRVSVQRKAPLYERRTEDCADLSMWLLIDFASWHGLPVTLIDNADTAYHSWDNDFSTRYQYYDRVKQRIGARALFNKNTDANPGGVMPGDLLLHPTHAAIIFAVYQNGFPHPQARNTRIPDFPGAEEAARQLTTTQYMRSRDATGIRVDYLNHRGTNGKQLAELIFNAPLTEMIQQGLEVRMYKWTVWQAPPRPSSSGCSVGPTIGR